MFGSTSLHILHILEHTKPQNRQKMFTMQTQHSPCHMKLRSTYIQTRIIANYSIDVEHFFVNNVELVPPFHQPSLLLFYHQLHMT